MNLSARRRLVAITHARYAIEHLVRLVSALPRGVCIVQHRDVRGPQEYDARMLRDATLASASLLLINGDIDLAKRVGADGVHLGGRAPDLRAARDALGDTAFVSIAAHDDEAVARAIAGQATAALVSPIFETPGHGPPRGTEAIRSARSIAGDRILLYALGGIDVRNAASCAEAGADGIAAIRAVFETDTAVIQLVQPFG